MKATVSTNRPGRKAAELVVSGLEAAIKDACEQAARELASAVSSVVPGTVMVTGVSAFGGMKRLGLNMPEEYDAGGQVRLEVEMGPFVSNGEKDDVETYDADRQTDHLKSYVTHGCVVRSFEALGLTFRQTDSSRDETDDTVYFTYEAVAGLQDEDFEAGDDE